MLMSEILHPGVVKINLDAVDKFEAIDELVDRLIQAHELPISQRDHAIEVVHARERESGTGMEHGVALPHGSTDRIGEIVGALGVSKRGVPFGSVDGFPAYIVILLLLPKRQFSERVHTLAGIAHLLENAELRAAMQNAADADSLLAAVERAEAVDKFAHIRTLP